ncbi:MAG: hypothetical protein OXL97_04355 [Chloroflexota bacterium]|nr:hypothetical protein [Chloroflexota bacterium]MDE2883943.1 hypothetical protein [Chloroflexota bacterium]
MILKEMPLFTETDIRQRRRAISLFWRDIPLPCYCELRVRENVVFTGGINTCSDDIDYVARQVVAMYYLATPPSVITYRYGYGEFLDEQIDVIFDERSEDYRDQLKRAAERHYAQLAYALDGAPARYRREH